MLSSIVQTSGVARWILLLGAFITMAFVVMAVFAPWIAPYGFAQKSADGKDFPKLASPGDGHLLGTNDLFYDVWSRTVWGARTEITVVVLAILLSVVVGVVLGIVSGYVGGWVDRVLVLIMDAMFSFPSLLLAIVFAFLLSQQLDDTWVASLLGTGVTAAALSLTVIYIPQYFRVVRNTTVSAREATYVEAARAIGAGRVTVMRRYLFPNVVQSVPVIATLNAADAISTLAALGFIGLGIQPQEAAEWGYDLQRALDDVAAGTYLPAVVPGIAIVLLVTGLTLLGEGLSETLNPTLRRRRLLPVTFPPRSRSGEEQ
jgi:peptide/nickel transport system permease protein